MTKRVIAAGVLAIVTAGSAAVMLADRGESAPPSTGRVSALDRLPTVAAVPPHVAQWAGLVSSRGAGRAAVPAIKRLRTDLGTARSDVYAYRNAAGGVCVYREHDGGTCSNQRLLRHTGIQWMLGGGTANLPGNLFALVTDDVTDVSVDVDGQSFGADIGNNIAFVEIPRGDRAKIVVSYKAGNTETVQVQLNQPFPAHRDWGS